MLSDASAAPARWTVELRRRARHLFVPKLLGTTLWTGLFFVAYFQLLRHPVHPVTVMPLTPLDRLIPFRPEALVAYVSLWLYVGVAPGLQRRFVDLVAYGAWAAALLLCGLAFFYLWPTAVPVATFDTRGFPGFALLQGLDAAGNACPSMHVAVALFTALWVDVALRETGSPGGLRWLNASWLAAIVYSTLALKQHVVVDALAGAALGSAFAWPSLRWRPRASRGEAPPASGYHSPGRGQTLGDEPAAAGQDEGGPGCAPRNGDGHP